MFLFVPQEYPDVSTTKLNDTARFRWQLSRFGIEERAEEGGLSWQEQREKAELARVS
jgi:hypothetical protein